MKRRLVLLLSFMLFSIGLALAQNKKISGIVVDDHGSPVTGATVIVKGTTVGASTDADGKFTINVPSGKRLLRFSIIGMKSVEMDAANNMKVALENDEHSLGEVEVVTTVLGIKRQSRELGYAATTISNKYVTQGKAVNVQQALNGKISGLNITTYNSGVFENAKLNIRGIRSLTGNNQPLFVLDGAPVSLSYLSNVSPEDIQDVTVLKSGASAALYGPDAVNGVVIVTTKRGTGGQMSVNYTTTIEASRVAYFPKLQHEFGPGAGEAQDAFGNYLYVPYENQIYGSRFDGSIQPIGIVNEQGEQQSGPYSNLWKNDKKKFFNTGWTMQHALSLSGKDYFFSVTNADITGLMPSDKNNRTTIRFNSGKTYKNLTLNYNVNYTYQNWDVANEADLPNLTTSSYVGSIMSNVLQVGDNVPLHLYKNTTSGWGSPDNYFNEFAFNPYWLIQELRQKGTEHNLIGTIDLSFKFKEWLNFQSKVSYSADFTNYTNTDGPMNYTDYTINVLKRNSTQYHNQPGNVYLASQTANRLNVDAFFSGSKGLTKDFGLKYVAGGMLRTNHSTDLEAGGNNLIVPYLYNLGNRSGEASALNSYVDSRIVSLYGNATLSYKNYVYLDLTGRNDWDSRLSKSNYSVFYPGASVAVMLSDIFPSIKKSPVNYLKLKGAINKSGNVNLGVYALEATYSKGAGFPFGSVPGYTAGNTIPSSNLKPEFVTTTELGFETRFLEDRINVDATYYNQQCDNQVLTVSQSWATGYPNALANAASFKNYGFEFDLSLTPLVKIGAGNFDLKFNATYNNNKVNETYGNAPVTLTGNGNFVQNAASNPTVNAYASVGNPAFQFQLTDYNRDPATGKVIVDAVTGDPSIATASVIKGRSMPLWILGITPSYTLGNFSVAMTWDYKGGHQFYAGVGPDMDFSGISARSAEYGRQRFVFPNSVYQSGTDTKGNPVYSPNTNIMVTDGNYGFWSHKTTNTGVATNYFASAAAWRLREVNISYSVPKKFLANHLPFVKGASLSMIGRNLLMFLPKSNQWNDPEFNSAGGNTFGISSAYQTPAARYYGGNISLTF